MLEEYPKEELQEIYTALPDDLKDALFSQETAGVIYDVCTKNDIKDSGLVSKLVGYTLLGLLPPNEFEKTLAKELKLNNDVAKNVANEITAVVFYPVKENLEALYKITIEQPPAEKKPIQKRVKDAYRELIE